MVTGTASETSSALPSPLVRGFDFPPILAAGVLVILQVFVNTTKFFFHEVMWQELFGAGPLGRDEPRLIDFIATGSAPVPVAAKP